MYLKKLSIINFKNIEHITVCFSKRFNFILGENGAGKSNLLDAIYYLCFCKSQYSEQYSQNIKHQKKFMNLKGYFHRNDVEEYILCSLQKGEKKKFQKNAKEYKKLADHIGFLPLVTISPVDNNIIDRTSEKRRKYIDKVIAQYDKLYLLNLMRYNKLLAQRNKLLKSYSKNIHRSVELLTVLNEQMLPPAMYIYGVRKKFCNKIAPIFQHYYNLIAKKNENIELNYHSQLKQLPYSKLIENSHEKDIELQFTTVGIHRDELDFLISGYPLKKEASQGQKKTCLVALKLAEYKLLHKTKGVKALLILDDIFGNFDDFRFRQIIKIIGKENIFGQIFISDTNRKIVLKMQEENSIENRIFTIKEGEISFNETETSTKNKYYH